jgi:hypothetical protein
MKYWLFDVAGLSGGFKGVFGSFIPPLNKSSTYIDPSVNLIGYAAITEMIKLQFTTITDRIQNIIRNGNWFPKFSIKGSKSGKKHPLPIDLSTENKKAKRSAYEKERRPGRSFNRKWKDKMNKQMTTNIK